MNSTVYSGLEQCFTNITMYKNYPESSLRHRLGPSPWVPIKGVRWKQDTGFLTKCCWSWWPILGPPCESNFLWQVGAMVWKIVSLWNSYDESIMLKCDVISKWYLWVVLMLASWNPQEWNGWLIKVVPENRKWKVCYLKRGPHLIILGLWSLTYSLQNSKK